MQLYFPDLDGILSSTRFGIVPSIPRAVQVAFLLFELQRTINHTRTRLLISCVRVAINKSSSKVESAVSLCLAKCTVD